MLRRSMYLLLALVLTLLWISPGFAAVPPDYTPVGPGDVYLALGDSLATGTEAPGNNDGQGGYPDHILARLQADNAQISYVNLGRAGETSGSMLYGYGSDAPQLERAIQQIYAERAAGRRVGLVTLDIGGNDMFGILPPFMGGRGAPPEQTLEEFAANLRSIFDQLQAALTIDGVRQGDLVIMNYYNAYPGLSSGLDAWIARFNGVIHSEAAQRGIPVAEVARAFAGHEAEYLYVQYPYNLFTHDTITAFDFHPRPAGHQAIAQEFLTLTLR